MRIQVTLRAPSSYLVPIFGCGHEYDSSVLGAVFTVLAGNQQPLQRPRATGSPTWNEEIGGLRSQVFRTPGVLDVFSQAATSSLLKRVLAQRKRARTHNDTPSSTELIHSLTLTFSALSLIRTTVQLLLAWLPPPTASEGGCAPEASYRSHYIFSHLW